MADQDADAGQESESSAPPVGTPASVPATGEHPDLKKLRRENQTLRARLKAATPADPAPEAEPDEVAALRDEVIRLRADRQRAVLAATLGNAGALYPDLLAAQVDLSQIEWEATGAPKAPDPLIKRLRAQYPRLWVAGSADGGAGGGAAPVIDMNALIRQRAGRA